MSSAGSSSYWCYRCSRFIRVLSQDSMACPNCNGGFIEEIDAPPRSGPSESRRRRLPATAMYMIGNGRNSDQGSSPVLRRNRSPFNPVIVLRGPSDAGASEEGGAGGGGFELFYDDGAGSGLRPLPASISSTEQSQQTQTGNDDETVGLTIWRLPGGGFAVGRFSGGRRGGERELPVVYTEMDGGFNNSGAPRRISWASRVNVSRESRGLRQFFRNLFGCFGGISSSASSSSSDSRISRRSSSLSSVFSTSSRRHRNYAWRRCIMPRITAGGSVSKIGLLFWQLNNTVKQKKVALKEGTLA
ncbi:E3 ubiquitin-protein like [Actinidia chinensis var. chinensis]|uniref:RING-type E3 ubiquitin transferase n=1 Tax=Actinidia chinensis var. chinensis TaxID=1590841 RepID=A0A2R6PLA3_ACTCC|nr:E3 ubiquitin-protein like [Actinidia chinensis var. chinensis]